MALDAALIATVQTVWGWAKSNVDLWCRALQDLKAAVQLLDLRDNQSLSAAAQFSLFPIVLNEFISYPISLYLNNNQYSLADFVRSVTTTYAILGIFALAHWVASRVLWGHASLRAIAILVLLGSSYLPIQGLLGYLVLMPVEQYSSLRVRLAELNLTGQDSAFLLLSALVMIFMFFKSVRAVSFVQRVGWFRATVMCAGTAVLSSVAIGALPLEMVIGLPVQKH